MASNLTELTGWLDRVDWPRATCPECGVGSVGFENATHNADRASQAILDLHHVGQGPPDELVGTFVGTLRCDNFKCRRALSMGGDWQLVINEGDPALGQFGDIYRLRYVNPALPIISVPESTPEAIKNAIENASVVLWISPSAAANQLRQSVEELLTARRVKKTTINKNGKRVHLSLHDRIAAFSRTSPEIAEALEAVKWIGNDGSHDNTLTVEDVLQGAEILDLAIKALYDKSDARLRAKARAINKAKGLRKRRAN